MNGIVVIWFVPRAAEVRIIVVDALLFAVDIVIKVVVVVNISIELIVLLIRVFLIFLVLLKANIRGRRVMHFCCAVYDPSDAFWMITKFIKYFNKYFLLSSWFKYYL